MGMVRDSFKLILGQLKESQHQDEKYHREFAEKRKQFDNELKQSQKRIDSIRDSIQRTKQ